MRLSILINLLVLLLASVSLPSYADEDDFTIYQTESRPSDELARLLRDLMGVRVQTMNEKVIIYGSQKQREAALKLMRELDKPAKTYRLRLRTIGRAESSQDAAAIEGRIGGRDLQVGKGKSRVLRGKGGGSVTIGGLKGRVESNSLGQSGEGGQQLTVIDGGTAEIGVGSDIFPTGARISLRSQGKSGVHLKLMQQDASSGGRVQNLSTEIDLKLGVWRSVGRIKQGGERSESEILGSSRGRRESAQEIQVMVELAD